MEKFNKFCIKYIKYISPIAVIAIILTVMSIPFNSDDPSKGPVLNFLIDIFGWIVVVWCALFAYLFFAIAFNEKLRNSFVRKLAGIKENDERESHITGIVSKKTFIASTGILVLLLFLSALQINIYRTPGPDDGKHGTIALGMRMTFVKQEQSPTTKEESERMYIVKYNGLPLTADGTLLLVMILQIGSFYYFSKKESLA